MNGETRVKWWPPLFIDSPRELVPAFPIAAPVTWRQLERGVRQDYASRSPLDSAMLKG